MKLRKKDSKRLARQMREMAAMLAPSREARLTAYRAAALRTAATELTARETCVFGSSDFALTVARQAEKIAQAMLAAEQDSI